MTRRNNINGKPYEGVCDIWHTVHSDELFVISKTKETVIQIKVCAIYGIWFTRMNYFRLGNATETDQPDQGVCNGGHTVHSDKLFVFSQENRNVSHKQDVCNTRQTSNYIGG